MELKYKRRFAYKPVHSLKLHKISFMKLQTSIPEIRELFFHPHDTAIQRQRVSPVRKLHKQRHTILHVHTLGGGKLGSLGRRVSEKNIRSVILLGMLKFNREPGQETFK